MIIGLLTLIFFQLLGFILVSQLSIPIPAPVAGLVILFTFLLIKGRVSEPLVKITANLLPLLPLFLIPASAGIIQYGNLLEKEWVPIATALTVSMLLSVLLIPFIFLFFMKLFGKRG